MARNNGQANSPSVGIGTGIGIMVGILALLFFATWVIYHDALSLFVLKYAYYINYPLAWITNKFGISYFIHLSSDVLRLAHNPSVTTLRDLFILTNRASMVYIPLLGCLAYIAYIINRHILRHLEVLHDYASLMAIQSKTNPCIVPVFRFTNYWAANKIERHKNLARAMTPDEFAKMHDLVKKSSDQIILDEELAEKIFIKELGRKFDKTKVSEHYKALAVIFMTRIVHRGEIGRKKAKEMQNTINNSCNPQKTALLNDAPCDAAFDFSCASSQFEGLLAHPDIQRIAAFFPYEKPFLMELLQQARLDGKLAPSEFLWLKLIDRPLFYALYGVSKNMIAKGYSEGAGAFTQYWASVNQRNRDEVLIEPVMHETVAGLEKRLFEANIISIRLLMTDREIAREAEFGRIPEV